MAAILLYPLFVFLTPAKHQFPGFKTLPSAKIKTINKLYVIWQLNFAHGLFWASDMLSLSKLNPPNQITSTGNRFSLSSLPVLKVLVNKKNWHTPVSQDSSYDGAEVFICTKPYI